MPPQLFIGVDVHVGALDGPHADLARRLRGFVLGLSDHPDCGVVVGIDAPRAPLPAHRPYYWDGTRGRRWRASRAGDRGLGRHCEIVVSALSLARPQWTPPRVEVSLAGFSRGPKDMLDAYCAAATVREHALGRGWEAGGGDGHGSIVFPGPKRLPESPVHCWPAALAPGP